MNSNQVIFSSQIDKRVQKKIKGIFKKSFFCKQQVQQTLTTQKQTKKKQKKGNTKPTNKKTKHRKKKMKKQNAKTKTISNNPTAGIEPASPQKCLWALPLS